MLPLMKIWLPLLMPPLWIKLLKISDFLSLESQQETMNQFLQAVDQNPILSKLEVFPSTDTIEVRKIILEPSSATCDLDAFPTALLKECLNELIEPLTDIVNLSLQGAAVPAATKRAIVTPLIKKVTLDPDNFKNYRPVSNLNFVSKVMEKVVAKRLLAHIQQNQLCFRFQSAYRTDHSIQTALLRVHNDISSALHKKCMVVLVLLDLSAVFDTIDHNILLSRLRSHFGITGNALNWFASYLSDRSLMVKVGQYFSQIVQLKYGVPQGSVLGPILFTMYTTPLKDIIQKHGVSYHTYADDTQLYLTFRPGVEINNVCSRLEECISDIKRWMLCNKLKLNDEKTEVLLLGSPYFLKKVPSITLQIGDSLVKSTSCAKNLGVLFDSEMNMHKFVHQKVSAAT